MYRLLFEGLLYLGAARFCYELIMLMRSGLAFGSMKNLPSAVSSAILISASVPHLPSIHFLMELMVYF